MSLTEAEILQRIRALELNDLQMEERMNALRLQRQQNDLEVARLREALRERRVRQPPLQEIVAAGRFHQSSVRYSISPLNGMNLDDFRSRYYQRILHFLSQRLLSLHNMKVVMGFTCNMHRSTSDGVVIDYINTFWSVAKDNAVAIYRYDEIAPMLNTIFDRIVVQIDEYTSNGSGWIFDGLTEVIINTYLHNPLNGRSYIKLPKKIEETKSCINIVNEDDNCFLWSILAFIGVIVDKSVTTHVNEPRSYANVNSSRFNFNMGGIQAPVNVNSLDKIEAMNPRFGFSVFALSKDDDENHTIYPLRVCKDFNIDEYPYEDPSKRMIVRLLLIQEEEKSHYVLIKDFSRSFSSRINNHQHGVVICDNCLLPFNNSERLKKHRESGCYNNDCVKIVLPTKDKSKLSYEKRPKHIKKLLKVPFAIYADFESILVPQSEGNVIQNHQACSYGYKIVSAFEEYDFPYKSFRGENAAAKFLESLIFESETLDMIMSQEKPMIITSKKETAGEPSRSFTETKIIESIYLIKF